MNIWRDMCWKRAWIFSLCSRATTKDAKKRQTGTQFSTLLTIIEGDQKDVSVCERLVVWKRGFQLKALLCSCVRGTKCFYLKNYINTARMNRSRYFCHRWNSLFVVAFHAPHRECRRRRRIEAKAEILYHSWIIFDWNSETFFNVT